MRFPVLLPYRITKKFSASHKGIDIAPQVPGTPGVQCLAPEGGRVILAGYKPALEGNYVVMQGVSGMFYYFGHFQTKLVGVGAAVSEGQTIGILGKTGEATGVHTHHEVRTNRDGGQINPEVYYKSQESVIVKPTEAQVYEAFRRYAVQEPANPAQVQYYLERDYSVLLLDLLEHSVIPKKPEVEQAFKDLQPWLPINTPPYTTQTAYYTNKPAKFLYQDLAVGLKKRLDAAAPINKEIVIDYIGKNLK